MWTPGTQRDFSQDLQKVRITSSCVGGVVFCVFVFLVFF